MSALNSIKKNMLMNVLLTASSVVFPLITYPYITRVLLPDGVGRIYLATSIVAYFTMFTQLGIPIYGVRACSKRRDNKEALSKLVGELLSINLIMCIPVYCLFILALFLVPEMAADRNLYVIIGTSIFFNAINTDWFYQGIEEYGYITKRSVLMKLIALFALFVLIHNPEDYILYGFISIFAVCASSVINLVNINKYIDWNLVSNPNLMQHFKPVMSFFMLSVMTTVYTNLDVVMLGFMTNSETVGCYGTAVKIKIVLVSIVTASAGVLLPRISYYIKNNELRTAIELVRRVADLLIYWALPITVFFIVFARESILVLAGEKFEGAIICMQIIMPSLVFIALSNIIGLQVLSPLDRERSSVIAVSIGALVDLVFNILFIPIYGAVGAAVGTLLAEVFVLSYLMYVSRDLKLNLLTSIQFGRILISSALAIALSLISRSLFNNNLLILIVASVIFALVYFSTSVICKEQTAVDLYTRIRRVI